MSSIYVKAASLLFQPTRGNGDLHHVAPFLVCHRGLFNCISPRIEHITPQPDATSFSLCFHRLHTVHIASSALTFHLTRDASFTIRYESDVRAAIAVLRKLTQVASMTLLRSGHAEANLSMVIAEVKRFSLTLTRLIIEYSRFDPPAPSEIDQLNIQDAVSELCNLKELEVPLLTPELCKAIAAGPSARLHELRTFGLTCQPTDVDELVAGCPNIWSLHLEEAGPFEFMLSASKLRYLQTLNISVDTLPLETDLRTCFSNMARLTQLDLSFYVSIGFSCEAIIASTVGLQLVEFSLILPLFSSDAFATLCCAASFPQLQRLFLYAGNSAVISDDVTVSLPPSLLELSLHNFELAPRTLTQLLSRKPNLHFIQFAGMTLSRRRGRNDDNVNDDEAANALTVANEDDDWFGQLVKCPVQRLDISACTNLAASIDTRIALLAPTLMSMSLDIGDWPVVPRDEFLGALFSHCLLLERVFYFSSAPSTAIDSKVAFAGLRNNERLRRLEIGCDISSPTPLVDELLAMRSADLHHLRLRTHLDIEQCIALAEWFVHLELVSAVFAPHNNHALLEQRFPHVRWLQRY